MKLGIYFSYYLDDPYWYHVTAVNQYGVRVKIIDLRSDDAPDNQSVFIPRKTWNDTGYELFISNGQQKYES